MRPRQAPPASVPCAPRFSPPKTRSHFVLKGHIGAGRHSLKSSRKQGGSCSAGTARRFPTQVHFAERAPGITHAQPCWEIAMACHALRKQQSGCQRLARHDARTHNSVRKRGGDGGCVGGQASGVKTLCPCPKRPPPCGGRSCRPRYALYWQVLRSA